jgi:hypothetical protein
MFMEVTPRRNVTSVAASCRRRTGFAFGDPLAARRVPAVDDATVTHDATIGGRHLRCVTSDSLV